MLEPAIEDRFQSAREAIEALQTGSRKVANKLDLPPFCVQGKSVSIRRNKKDPDEWIAKLKGSPISIRRSDRKLVVVVPPTTRRSETRRQVGLQGCANGCFSVFAVVFFLPFFFALFLPLLVFALPWLGDGIVWFPLLPLFAIACLLLYKRVFRLQKITLSIDPERFSLHQRSWFFERTLLEGETKNLASVRAGTQTFTRGESQIERPHLAFADAREKPPTKVDIQPPFAKPEQVWIEREVNDFLLRRTEGRSNPDSIPDPNFENLGSIE